MDPLTVVVYGCVGVGKSTVVEALDDGKCVFGVREPVDAMIASGALEDVYANRSSSGMRLQMLVLAQRLSTYWAVASRMANASLPPGSRPIVVCDGHIGLDPLIFVDEHRQNGRMSKHEYLTYGAAAPMLQSFAPSFAQLPELYIFLRASPKTCYERAAARGRTAETTLDLDFFTRIANACERISDRLFKEQTTDQTLVVIDTDNLTDVEVVDAVRHAVQTHANAISDTVARRRRE